MANYASNIITGDSLNGNALEQALDDALPTKPYTINAGTTVSHTPGGTTPFVIGGLTLGVSAVSDELIVVQSTVSLSGDNAGDRWYFYHEADGNAGAVATYYTSTGFVTGEVNSVSLMTYFEGLSGAITVETMAVRELGSGSVYTSARTMNVFRHKLRG